MKKKVLIEPDTLLFLMKYHVRYCRKVYGKDWKGKHRLHVVRARRVLFKAGELE